MGRRKKVIALLGIIIAVTMTGNLNVYAEQPAQGQENVQPAQPEQPAQPAQPAAPEAGQAATNQATQAATNQAAQPAPAAAQAATQAATAQQQQAPATRRSNTRTTANRAAEEASEEPVETGPTTEEGKYILLMLKNANLRSEPSTSGKSLVVVPSGIKLTGISKTTNEAGDVWYQLSYAGTTGYVREDMVNVEAVNEDNTEQDAEEDIGEEEENTEATAEEENEEREYTELTSEAIDNTKTSESTSDVTTGVTGIQIASYTAEENEEVQSVRKMDGYMLLFITLATVSFCLACYIFLRIRIEYMKAKSYVMKKMKRQAK